jgi:hypothetical protein
MPGLRLAPEGPALLVGTNAERLEAVLVHRPAGRRAETAPPRLISSVWREAQGRLHFGWPGPDGSISGLETALVPRRAVLLAPALALAAALRRASPGLGTRCLVVGEGMAAALARAVAADFGTRDAGRRITEVAAKQKSIRPGLVIVTEPSGEHLEAGLKGVEDGGSILALGEPADLPPIDFYPHVHRRGLRLDIVAWWPDREEAGALWTRGRSRLERLANAFDPGTDAVVSLARRSGRTRLVDPGSTGVSRRGVS